MVDAETRERVRRRFELLCDDLDERQRRLWAAAEATVLGYGGVSAVSEATGMARSTVTYGVRELEQGSSIEPGRTRRPGAGRKLHVETQAGLAEALEELVEPVSRGDPTSPLRWTTKSTRKLATELTSQGFQVSRTKVAELLKDLGYSLQATRKTTEGKQHSDRNAQFEYINEVASEFQATGQPVISVDTKKKELVGDFASKGREYQPKGQPEKVRVHDFIDKELGKAIPYGVYDVSQNTGWVNVGTDRDTAVFAVNTIRQWWLQMGRHAYRQAERLLITADGGGSNSSRSHLWKFELQRLADETGLVIDVCHLPPGTSKWNKIEHRLFSAISQNWRGRPLVSHEAIVNLIANTTTTTGLKVHAELDRGEYPTGIKVPPSVLKAIELVRDEFHGEWNYAIWPREPDAPRLKLDG